MRRASKAARVAAPALRRQGRSETTSGVSADADEDDSVCNTSLLQTLSARSAAPPPHERRKADPLRSKDLAFLRHCARADTPGADAPPAASAEATTSGQTDVLFFDDGVDRSQEMNELLGRDAHAGLKRGRDEAAGRLGPNKRQKLLAPLRQ